MCRWLALISTHAFHLAEIVNKPDHSIFRYQSKHAGILLENWGFKLNSIGDIYNHIQRNGNLNGDGCGLGAYLMDDCIPLIFTSVLPAWNNRNLLRLTDRLRSRLFFAHVRAASSCSPVSEVNAHPFQFGKLMWMHNGEVAKFSAIRRKLVIRLHAKSFDYITGTTDTEHAGALFVDMLPRKNLQRDEPDTEEANYTIQELADTMERTIGEIVSLVDEVSASSGPEQHASSLNFCVSNGKCIVAARWRNSEWQSPPLLFYTSAATFKARPDEFGVVTPHSDDDVQMTDCGPQPSEKKSVIISSEPLNHEKEKWHMVPKNHLICVNERGDISVVRIAVPMKRYRNAVRKWLARARSTIAAKRQVIKPDI